MYQAHCKPSILLAYHLDDDIRLKLFSERTGIPVLRLLEIKNNIGNATHEEMIVMAFHLQTSIDNLRGDIFIPPTIPPYIELLHN